MSLTKPLDDFSTQQARADEARRRKLRRELLAQIGGAIDALTAESIAAIRGISDAEWKAAQEQDDGDV